MKDKNINFLNFDKSVLNSNCNFCINTKELTVRRFPNCSYHTIYLLSMK